MRGMILCEMVGYRSMGLQVTRLWELWDYGTTGAWGYKNTRIQDHQNHVIAAITEIMCLVIKKS